MSLQLYIRGTKVKWMKFKKENPEIGKELGDLIFGIGSEMSEEQIGSMWVSDNFFRLKELSQQYAKRLGIRNDTDKELALWVRTICFFEIS